ncbi:hypothetical protein J7E87_23370 [Streptomyces sp. ISL-1]|uniref:hypothetical protein n=1 Tax=Streptomyces sp. ISL-1 TaxID=2817657 RepID=UPI001BE52B06|nr:hypothetical protein [Streptomyces sp. ISL-1]MBT2392281.1 hypothetical protein [Streptomyces sp. ISL-1]
MSEPEQLPSVPPSDPEPEPGSAGPAPAMPGHAPPAPPGSRWARLSRGKVLLLGVGIGVAAVGAGWLTTSLLGSDADKENDGGTSSSTTAADETSGPEPFGTDGSITLASVGAGLESGALCSGTGGYSDIDFGTQVNITDAAGTLVAHGSLDLGEKTEAGCTFPFTVDDITPGSKFYTVEVSHRGGLTQTEAELRAGGLEFTLGD